MAFMGTRVSRGRARGIVANTGVYTELGAIAGMLARVEPEETPLEQDLERFGQRVVLGCIAISAVVFAAGFFLSKSPPRELFLVAVALAVAAIPEGLPAVTTIVLALGTTRMARRHALVRRLPAVETLGCAQVICTDKTGTLTQNAMTARKLWVGGVRYDVDGGPRVIDGGIRPSAGEGPAESIDLQTALDAAAHARGAHLTLLDGKRVEIQGDPTDAALLILSHRLDVKCEHTRILGEQPFTSQRRMASVLVGGDQAIRSYVRGAPEVLLERATTILRDGRSEPLGDADRDAITGEAAKWAGRSMRVIALAMREGLPVPLGPVKPSAEWEAGLTFIGAGRHRRSAAPRGRRRHRRGAQGRHPHHHDHRRSPRHRARHRRRDRTCGKRATRSSPAASSTTSTSRSSRSASTRCASWPAPPPSTSCASSTRSRRAASSAP